MCLCNFMSLRTSSVNITHMQVEKYSNKKNTQLLLTWNLCRLMLTFVGFLFFLFTWRRLWCIWFLWMCLRVSSYRCDLCGAVNQPTLHRTWLHPRPFPFPPQRQKWCHCAMMEHKSNPRVLAPESGAWFIFMTSLFRCSHLLRVCCCARGTTRWPKARSAGFHPRPRCSVSPWPISRKPIVTVVTQNNNKIRIAHINHRIVHNIKMNPGLYFLVLSIILYLLTVFVCAYLYISVL